MTEGKMARGADAMASLRFVSAVVVMLVLSAVGGMPAKAALDAVTISQAGFHVAPGAQVPLDAVVTGREGPVTLRRLLAGKPALLVFVDYQCRSLCGVVLDRLADVIPGVPLGLGRDYNVVSVALGERQTQVDALAFRDRHVGGTSLAALGAFLTEDRTARNAIEQGVGLVAPYDQEKQRFAHPTGLVALDGDGRVKVVLSPFAIDARDVELALTQGGTPSSLIGHVLQLCYGYNALTGLYDVRIERLLAIAAAVTILLLGAGVCTLLLFERNATREKG